MNISLFITTFEIALAVAAIYYGIRLRLDKIEMRVEALFKYNEKSKALPIRIFKDIVRSLGKESYIMSKKVEKILLKHTELKLS